MFRRSRFSIRPNVGTTGKTAATPPEAPSENQETNETPKDVSESCAAAAAVSDNKPVVTPSEKPTVPGDGNDQHGEGTSSSAAVQRRKRVSIKPKVAPGRPSTLARTAKTPAKADSETPVEVPGSDLDKPTTSSQTGTSAAPQRLQSPRRRRLSEESKQLKIQPKATLIPSDSSEPSVVPTAEDSPEQTHLPTDCGKEIESTSGSQGKEVKPDKVPLSLPDKEAVEISEKAKTLVSSKSRLSLSAPAFSLSRLLNDPSDLQRLAKARKLRELLKQEIHKEKKIKKAKARAQEYNLDPAKMTMRDLIRYLPLSNPMTSCLEDTVPENETVVPPSPEREKSPVKVKEPDVVPKMASPREEEVAEAEAETEVEPEAEAAADEEADEEAEAGEEEDDDGMMVPQVKVAEDGSLIIDEESLTVEVQRAKGPNPAQDRDPIFERGSTTTYSSFRKGTYSKPWSSEETDMFFLAISMVGTDFSMICQLFPHRARSEIKNKFKKEERENSWRIDKAFRDRRKLDIEYFSKLLEKILEVQKNRKKLKSLAEKKSPKKRKRKSKGKKAGRKLSDVEEEDEEEQKECPDLEKEGEKENEDLCNEGGTTDVKPKKKRKRKNASTEEPNDKKNKKGETSNEQDEALMPGDTEAALPEDCPKSDMSEKTESVNEAEDISIKPAKLSRGRAPKPLLPLGRKYGKKPPPPSTKTNDNPSDKEDESVIDGASDKQVNKDASPLRQDDKSANDDISSEEEVATVQPPRPTRYGRLPKPTKTLNYPATEAAHSTESESNYASPAGSTASAARPNPKCTAKRGRSSKLQSAQESKKPKLVTLRASQLEYTDDEDETQGEDEKVEEELHTACSPSRDSTAPVFVPASLRSPQPVISEVEETMEELDILANMPDVLGISQDALCPEASCERAQNETGTAEPCEHQLDLLVDVINFLSPDPTEVSEDESYNEAAQTLLTIGNMAHLSQSAQNLMDIQDHITGTTSVSVNETTQMLEEEITSKPAAQEENSSTPLISATSVDGLTETVTTVKLQNSTTDEDIPVIKSSDQTISSDMDPNPQLPSSLESSNTSSPQTRRGRLSKVKTKPNLGKASRTAQTKSQPETVTVRTAEESHMDAPDVSQATETLSAAEEAPKVADSSKTLLKDDISCIEVKRTEEPSGTRKSRFQKVKPNLNLAQTSRTVRSKPQTTNDMLEKDSDPSPNPKFHEKIIVEVEAEPTCTTSSEQPSESQSPASDLIPLLDLGTTLTEELSTTEKKETDRGVVGQMESDAVTSHQSASENQNLSEAQFEARREQVTRDKRQTSGSTDKVLMSHVGTTESSCNNSLTSDAAVTESQTGQGSNIDSTPVQESSDLPTPCVTPAEELPVCKIEESEVRSTRQTRMSRVQKVKPNLNLAQASRTVRSKTQTTKDAIEKHSNPTPNLKLDGKTIIEIEAEPTCSTSPEQPSPCPASVLIPLLDLGTTLTEELSTTEKKETDRGVVGQMESDAATSHQSASENQNFSEAQFEPSLEQSTIDSRSTSGSTDEVLRSHVGAMESSYNNQVTSDTAVTELQTGQRSNVDSTPVQESSNLPAPCVTPAEELPVCKIEQSEVRSTRQTRMSRVQKVKPNLNLAQTSRTVRSKPQTTKDIIEKHSNPTPNPKLDEKKILEIEAEPTCSTSPEQPSQSPASVLIPLLDLGTTPTPIEELSTTEEKKTDFGVFAQVVEGTATSHSPTENQNLSEAQFEASRGQTTRESSTTSESTDIKLTTSQIVKIERSCNNPPTSDSSVTESQVGQGSNIAKQESKSPPASRVTPVEELPVSQKEESKAKSTCQTMRGLQTVKPKINLSRMSRTVQSKRQVTKDPVTPMQLAETHSSPTSRSDSTDEAQPTCSTTPPEKQSQIKSTGTASVSVPSLELCSSHKTTNELSSTEKQNIDVGCGLDSNSEGSGQNVLHRRQRFPKVKPKPNLGSSPRTTQTKLQSSVISKPLEQCHMDTSLTTEQQPVDNNNAQSELELAETDGKHLTSTHCSLRTELISSTLRPAESDKSLDRTSDKGMSFDGVVIASSWVAENQSVLTDSVFENERSEKPAVEGESTGDKMSNNDKVEAGPASQQEKSIKATETNTQPTAVSDVQSSKDGSTESSLEDICPTITQSTPDSKESTETNQTAARSTDDNQSEPTDSPSRKAPQTRRARLIKPKPSLGRSRRPLQPQQVQNTKQAEAEIGTCSGVDGVSERRPDIQEPVEGAIEQCRDQIPSPNVAGSAPGCLAQVRDSCTQDASTSSTQSRPSLTRFPDMRQEPSDADEPFFILSLTEIPVCSSGAAVGSVPEPLPYLHVTDASIEQQSIPGESLGAAGDRPLSNVPVPAMEESGETGLINVKDIGPDPAAYIGSIVGNPVDPHESTTVHPSKGQETIENNDETPPTKQRLMGTRRREPAKLQVKPNITKRKQASKTLAAKKAESISIQTNTPQLSELPGPSVPSKAFDDVVTEPQKGSGHHVDVEKEKRKGKGSLSLVSETNIVAPASDSPPGKAASKSSKFKTPRAAGKKTPPAHVASTSYDVAPTPSPTHSAEDTHSSTTSSTQTEAVVVKTSERSRPCSDQSPSTSPCPAEVSASQQSDCVESSSIEEEPTSVSQYFLSDIFTEVEEG